MWASRMFFPVGGLVGGVVEPRSKGLIFRRNHDTQQMNPDRTSSNVSFSSRSASGNGCGFGNAQSAKGGD